MNEEQERFRQIIYQAVKALNVAIVTGGIAMAKPKAKPEDIVELAIKIAEVTLEKLNAKALITALVQDPPPSGEVSKFFIKES